MEAMKEAFDSMLPQITEQVAAELRKRAIQSLVSGVIAAVETLSGHLQESITKRIASYDGDKLVAEVMRVLTPSRY